MSAFRGNRQRRGKFRNLGRGEKLRGSIPGKGLNLHAGEKRIPRSHQPGSRGGEKTRVATKKRKGSLRLSVREEIKR